MANNQTTRPTGIEFHRQMWSQVSLRGVASLIVGFIPVMFGLMKFVATGRPPKLDPLDESEILEMAEDGARREWDRLTLEQRKQNMEYFDCGGSEARDRFIETRSREIAQPLRDAYGRRGE